MFQWPPSDHAALVAHVYLLGGDVFATIAVGLGILWESEAITVSHKTAGRLVFWGVVLETVCSIALFTFDEGVSSAQQSTIEAQKSEIITLGTKLVQADANLLNEQRVTARERMRLERIERAVLPRSSYVDWSKLIGALKDGHFQPVNIVIVGGAEAQNFGFNLMSAFAQAGAMGKLLAPPSEPGVRQYLGYSSSGVTILTANPDGQKLGELLWRQFQIGGGAESMAGVPPAWTDLPRDVNCLLIQDNGWAMAPGAGQPGEDLDVHGRPVPAPQ
jgi:hypothetical protein